MFPVMLKEFFLKNKFMKATAIAPSNIALIKYWGKKDEKLRLPANSSISINLSGLKTITTVEFSPKYEKDEVIIDQKENAKEGKRVSQHLDRIRKLAKISLRAKVISKNNFPKSSGLASSASGFAALTLAGAQAAGLNLSQKELTVLARLGSGSACRSIPDGFVEWRQGKDSQSSYAYSLFPTDYWDLSIITTLVESGEKKVSTSSGHQLAKTSHFFKTRLKKINDKIVLLKNFIKEKNFLAFGELVEKEALEMHAIMLTSTPSLIYWQPATIEVLKYIQNLREAGLPVYGTIDAGPHLYIICERKNEKELINKLKKVEAIKKVIINRPAPGARLVS